MPLWISPVNCQILEQNIQYSISRASTQDKKFVIYVLWSKGGKPDSGQGVVLGDSGMMTGNLHVTCFSVRSQDLWDMLPTGKP